MLRTCSAPGCTTMTLGELCVAHEPVHLRVFARGRPFARREEAGAGADEPLFRAESRQLAGTQLRVR